jgi:hypothetical protein
MRRKLIVALTIATVALAGCAGPPASSGSGSTALNVYLYQEPAGQFGPLAPSSGPDNQVMSFLYEGLLGVDPNYELQPRLAESYEALHRGRGRRGLRRRQGHRHLRLHGAGRQHVRHQGHRAELRPGLTDRDRLHSP